jgi:hypothetical protein
MRYHRSNDGWGRGSYKIPQYAIVGSSCTGDWSDSPCPTNLVKAELEGFRKVLRLSHIRSSIRATQTGNGFMVKVWVCVKQADYDKALPIANTYLNEPKVRDNTRYIHDAN